MKDDNPNGCDVPRCRRVATATYYGDKKVRVKPGSPKWEIHEVNFRVCDLHQTLHAEGKKDLRELLEMEPAKTLKLDEIHEPEACGREGCCEDKKKE